MGGRTLPPDALGTRTCLSRCRANMAHIRQSGPDSGLAFQVPILETCWVVPCSLGSGVAGSAPTKYAVLLLSSLFLPSLELSDTKVYEPSIRALLGSDPHFCGEVLLKLGAVPIGAVHCQPASFGSIQSPHKRPL